MQASRTSWLPLGILVLALGLTWLVWNHERQSAQLQLKTHFDFALQEAISRIEQRMGSYEQLLRGVQAQYVSMGKIDRKGLHDYVATLRLDANFSGVQAIGQLDWVPAEQRERHVAKMRQLGFNEYTIRPEGLRDAYAPVVQREPYIGRNRVAFGFDTWSEPVRRLALERARDSGMPAISGRLILGTETGPVVQPGIVMVLPIYASNKPVDSLEQRRANVIAWAFASFRMSDLMASLYGQFPPGISFSINDGIEISDQTLLYQSDRQQDTGSGILTANEYLVIGGRTWTLSMTASSEFARRFGQNDAPLIAWSGIGLSLLLTYIAWLLTTSRARALRLAQTMTSELRASERFVHTVTDNIPGLVAYWNSDLRCEFANACHQEFFGKAAAAIPGIHIRELVGEETYRRVEPHIQAVLRGEAQFFEGKLTKPDGSISHTYANYLPDSQGGQVKGFYVLVSDITPLKQVEAELAEHRDRLELLVEQRTAALSIAKEAAEAANRAKTVFLATMSHELRTPMNAIMGLTGIVRRATTDPKQIDQLDKVLAASNQLLMIINDILELSRVEANHIALERVEFRLADMLERLASTFRPETQRKDLSLHMEVDPDLARRPLQGDPVRLEQILFKLISNAIKFSAAGSVEVRALLSEEAATQLVLRFEVADTGIGIPAEEQGRLFSAFEQLDGSMSRRYGGAGLGLAISKRLVQAMGGSIGVESQFGAGSTFWFTVRLGKG
jgi:PAS domain S-box-containing protein